MKEIKVFSTNLNQTYRDKLAHVIHNFDDYEGGVGDRNVIKIINIEEVNINIKAFKTPNVVNKIVYNFFRKSKAQRSFEYANKLKELGIGTPKPLAYFEYKTPFYFGKSYYVSEQLHCDITYRELIHDFNYPDYDNILRLFTRFTFGLHEKGILFLDHSPGNTLIKKSNKGYDFFLVDLNRMEFKTMDFETRIKNFSRLTPHESMVEVMSDEYAKCIGEDKDKVFKLMWQLTQDFQEKFLRKKRLKKKLMFWKKT